MAPVLGRRRSRLVFFALLAVLELAGSRARTYAQPEAIPPGVPAAPAPPAPAPSAPETVPSLSPPRVLRSEAPAYPPAHLGDAQHPTVVLRVVVDAEGHVTDAEVEHGAGPGFDEAALESVRRWLFEPARRDGVAIPSRIRVSVHFDPPTSTDTSPVVPSENDAIAPEATPTAEQAATAAETPGEATHDESALFEEQNETGGEVYDARAEVELARLRAADRAASDFELDARALHAAPATEAGQLLSRAPGVFVSRPEGDAIANRIMLRGFDAEHGQDIEFNVAGVPVDQPSHIHGQGTRTSASSFPRS